MGIKTSIAATLVLIVYLAVVVFTDYLQIGYVVEITILLILTGISFFLAFNARIEKTFPVLLWRLFNMALAVGIVGYFGLKLVALL